MVTLEETKETWKRCVEHWMPAHREYEEHKREQEENLAAMQKAMWPGIKDYWEQDHTERKSGLEDLSKEEQDHAYRLWVKDRYD